MESHSERQMLTTEEKMETMASLTKEEIDLRKVFIDHVPCDVSNEDIENEFSKHGPLLEVAKYQDRKDPLRHYAFVTFKYPQDCKKATENPEPLIKGKKVECWLAAIGSSFSGFKFFCEMGVLNPKTDSNNKMGMMKPRRQNNGNNIYNNNSNSSNSISNNNNNNTNNHNYCNGKGFQRTIPSNNHYHYRSSKRKNYQNKYFNRSISTSRGGASSSQWKSYETVGHGNKTSVISLRKDSVGQTRVTHNRQRWQTSQTYLGQQQQLQQLQESQTQCMNGNNYGYYSNTMGQVCLANSMCQTQRQFVTPNSFCQMQRPQTHQIQPIQHMQQMQQFQTRQCQQQQFSQWQSSQLAGPTGMAGPVSRVQYMTTPMQPVKRSMQLQVQSQQQQQQAVNNNVFLQQMQQPLKRLPMTQVTQMDNYQSPCASHSVSTQMNQSQSKLCHSSSNSFEETTASDIESVLSGIPCIDDIDLNDFPEIPDLPEMVDILP